MCKSAFIDLLNAEVPTTIQWHSFLVAAQRDNSFRASVIQSAHEMLREAIDAWIDSGFQPDGRELAEKRCLRWKEFPLAIGDMGTLLSSAIGGEGETAWLSPYQDRKPRPQYGRLRVRFEPRGGFSFDPEILQNNLPAELLAALGFFVFWQSDWLPTLMRCAKCRKYSIARPRQKPYVHGWHCKRCQKSALAMASMKNHRKTFRRQWFGLAVNAWREYGKLHPKPRNGDVAFITQQVNKKYPAIRRNTITRNLPAIKAGKDPKAEPKLVHY